ncbi:hypothetical protein [Streptomyces sp. ISL-100]|uniref:hypothetical protein n=1 Tax=Streptomyces sp. ISL-100 TaxID=2819173 RepID=UPI00203619E4|nr:hypothetical protein [Streptomyces sp. ISL-100]
MARRTTRLVTLVALPAALALAAVASSLPAVEGTAYQDKLDPLNDSGGNGTAIRGGGFHPVGGADTRSGPVQSNEVSSAVVAAGGVAFVAVAGALAVGRKRPAATTKKPADGSAA